MNVLGVILARGGSVRCPRKNVRMLGSHPLIAYTIIAAHQSMFIKEVVVSSDSDEILDLARFYDADVLRRPAEMATAEAEAYPALMHAINSWNKRYDIVCLLQPTSPFRIAYDADCCIMGLLYRSAWPAFASVTEGEIVPNGACYAAHIGWLRESLAMGTRRPFDGPACGRYIMPRMRSLDINTEEDFSAAEAIIMGMAA